MESIGHCFDVAKSNYSPLAVMINREIALSYVRAFSLSAIFLASLALSQLSLAQTDQVGEFQEMGGAATRGLISSVETGSYSALFRIPGRGPPTYSLLARGGIFFQLDSSLLYFYDRLVLIFAENNGFVKKRSLFAPFLNLY